MHKAILKRRNLLVEDRKVRLLRRKLRARSDSEAIRIAVDRELAVKGIEEALTALRTRGTLEDVFGRLKPRHQ